MIWFSLFTWFHRDSVTKQSVFSKFFGKILSIIPIETSFMISIKPDSLTVTLQSNIKRRKLCFTNKFESITAIHIWIGKLWQSFSVFLKLQNVFLLYYTFITFVFFLEALCILIHKVCISLSPTYLPLLFFLPSPWIQRWHTQ